MDSTPTIDEPADRIFAWRRGFNASWLIDLGITLNSFSESLPPIQTARYPLSGAQAGRLAGDCG